MSYPIIGDSTVLHSPPAKNKRGPVAQLGARTVRIRKVEGSIPFGSTTLGRSRFEISRVFFMLSGCTIVHTLVPFRMQEVEELCDTDFEFHFDFKVPPDIHPLNELPQDHLLSLDTTPRI